MDSPETAEAEPKRISTASTGAEVANEASFVGPEAEDLVPRKLHETIVIIEVGSGDEQEEFAIHKDLIAHHSPFFQSATKDFWKESQTGIIKLPNDHANVFRIFANWLYTQSFTLEKGQTQDFMLLVEIYVFGDKVGTPAFQNASIDAICRLCKSRRKTSMGTSWWTKPSERVITFAYLNTVDGSPLRQLFVDAYAYAINFAVEPGKKSFHDIAEEFPPKFIIELFRAHCLSLPQGPGGKPCPFDNKGCVYHTHPDGVKCGDGEPAPKRIKIFA